MNSARILIYFINLVFALIEILLLLRIVFLLFGANPNTPFIAWIYDISKSILYPFQGIFPSPILKGGFVLDISALVAMLIYALINYLIIEFIRFISFNSSNYYETRTRYKQE